MTVRLHRVLRAPPERVHKAFLDPAALAKWSPPHGFVGHVHSMDARVGGGYSMDFTNLGTGESHSFRGTFHEITPERIRYSDRFDDPGMGNEMPVTIELQSCVGGTELTITQENLPEQIPTEMALMGWQESLDLLRLLVEPEIPRQEA